MFAGEARGLACGGTYVRLGFYRPMQAQARRGPDRLGGSS